MSDQTPNKTSEWLDGFRDNTEKPKVEAAPPGFVLDELLGRGGMAEVYLAHRNGPRGFSRKVVIKRIRPDKAGDPIFVERFVREASLSAQFHHPNIVEILELVTNEDGYSIVMEYLAGENLGRVLNRLKAVDRHCPPDIAAHVVSSLASALDYAHNFADEQGEIHQIVHRDISPDNVMVSYAGQVKLLDFGVAKDLQGTMLTQGDKIIGKPLYLPPEALQGTSASPARDVYSLGMVLYVLLCGRFPFDVRGGPEGLAKLMVDIAEKPIPPVRKWDPKIPIPMESLTQATLAKNQHDRPTAGELQNELEQYLSTQPRIQTSTISGFLRELGDESGEPIPTRVPSSHTPSQRSYPKTPTAAKPQPGSSTTQRPTTPARPVTPEPASTTPTPLPAKPSTPWEAESSPGSEQPTQSGQTPTAVLPAGKPRVEPRPPEPQQLTEERPRRRERQDTSEHSALKNPLFAGGVAALVVLVLGGLIWLAYGSGDPAPDPDSMLVPKPIVATPVPVPTDPTNPDSPTTPVPQPTPVAPAIDLGAAMGTLVIKCDSWGWVFVDNKRVGMCPRVVTEVPAGQHVIELEARRGKRKTVNVRAGGEALVKFRTPKGSNLPNTIPMSR